MKTKFLRTVHLRVFIILFMAINFLWLMFLIKPDNSTTINIAFVDDWAMISDGVVIILFLVFIHACLSFVDIKKDGISLTFLKSQEDFIRWSDVAKIRCETPDVKLYNRTDRIMLIDKEENVLTTISANKEMLEVMIEMTEGKQICETLKDYKEKQ